MGAESGGVEELRYMGSRSGGKNGGRGKAAGVGMAAEVWRRR